MSWRDQLRDGSFRGVAFQIMQAQTRIGRRGQLHEYPLRDKPWGEDLGRLARRFEVECVVVGTDYMAARDALIAALEQKGAGTLVHPYYGTRSVVVFDGVSIEESTREGGMARFRIPFEESGEKLEPATTTDTVATVNAKAANAQAQLVSNFANSQYSVSKVASWVSDSALSDLGDLTTKLQALRDGIPGIPSSVTAFNTLLQGFTGSLSSLMELNQTEVAAVSGGMPIGGHPFMIGFEKAMIGLSTVGFGIMGGIAGSLIGPEGTVLGAAIGTAIGNGIGNEAADNMNSIISSM